MTYPQEWASKVPGYSWGPSSSPAPLPAKVGRRFSQTTQEALADHAKALRQEMGEHRRDMAALHDSLQGLASQVDIPHKHRASLSKIVNTSRAMSRDHSSAVHALADDLDRLWQEQNMGPAFAEAASRPVGRVEYKRAGTSSSAGGQLFLAHLHLHQQKQRLRREQASRRGAAEAERRLQRVADDARLDAALAKLRGDAAAIERAS